MTAPADAAAPGRAELAEHLAEIVTCTRCPRLVAWRRAAAADPPRRFAGEPYWARPVPPMGEADARVLIVGLAPAAHGGNRTGRIFTGDRSGDVLFAALHATGFASSPVSRSATDGVRLDGAYIGAVNRCAPPDNRPTPQERDACLPYLARELRLLREIRVVLCLGAFAWDGALRALVANGEVLPRPRPAFGHGAEARVGAVTLLGCFHPSQQNTFTGRLTPRMLEDVLRRARAVAGSG